MSSIANRTPQPRSATSPANALTVDLEDWFSLAHRIVNGEDVAPSDRVVVSTRIILDLLDETATKATFFVLGRVADEFPSLVREVADRGHEIASHGASHRRVHDLGVDQFRSDLASSVRSIERACGVRPIGFRAPEFSVTRRSPWAFEVLAKAGFRYDSSVFPIRHRRYGISGAPTRPYVVRTSEGRLREFPMATLKVAGQRMPIAGGGYLRLLPYRVVAYGVERMNADDEPATLYVHPYEFDPKRLSVSSGSRWLRAGILFMTANLRRSGQASKIRMLLRRFRFTTLADLAAKLDQEET